MHPKCKGIYFTHNKIKYYVCGEKEIVMKEKELQSVVGEKYCAFCCTKK